MKIEYEATFVDIDPAKMRQKLQAAGAKCKRSEYLQRRSVYLFPKGNEVSGGWVRVRDEGDVITMSVKVVDGDRIEDQKEACVEVSDYVEAEHILQALGCIQKAYQETRRELWIINDVEVTIDTWPFLDPFIEIEGASELVVREVAEKLGCSWQEAKFCSVATLYNEVYGTPVDIINNQTPRITFDMENPFV